MRCIFKSGNADGSEGLIQGRRKDKTISHVFSIGYHWSGATGHLWTRDRGMSGYPGLKGRIPVILLWKHSARLAAPSLDQIRCLDFFQRSLHHAYRLRKVPSLVSLGVNSSLPIRGTMGEGLPIRQKGFGAKEQRLQSEPHGLSWPFIHFFCK